MKVCVVLVPVVVTYVRKAICRGPYMRICTETRCYSFRSNPTTLADIASSDTENLGGVFSTINMDQL